MVIHYNVMVIYLCDVILCKALDDAHPRWLEIRKFGNGVNPL